jgi:hypothetical protein
MSAMSSLVALLFMKTTVNGMRLVIGTTLNGFECNDSFNPLAHA